LNAGEVSVQAAVGNAAGTNHAPIRVLFLTRYPVEGASSRYRVFQYLEHLRSLGVECTVQSFMSPEMYRISFAPGRTFRKLWETAKAGVRRLRAVAGHRGFDIVYMQRELLPFGPPLLERWMKARGARLFFDYDDALFIGKPSRYNPLATLLRAPGKVLELFRLADCVVAGNDWLRDEAARHGARAVTVEVAEDTGRIAMHAPHDNARPVTVGWLGSTSTVKYLRLIEPALQEVAAHCPQLRFEIMGGGDFAMAGVPWQVMDWSLDGELAALQRYDIGLMPLPMETWAQGKSGGKARTYMAAGVVPVCSAIGYNLELIQHGHTGFLCATQGEWREAIIRLVEDATLRQRVAEAARAEVERRFSPVLQAGKLRELFVANMEQRR
jgi:glycosyltransferase involved in cell wall biosynthesis